MDATIFGVQIFMLLGCVAGFHYSYGTYCDIYNRYYSYTYYTYCDYGCCTYQCCEKIDHGLTAAAIVGIVIGSLIALVLLVSFVVCCICVCCKKSRGNAGIVVHPSPSVVATPYPNVHYMRTDHHLPPLGAHHVHTHINTSSVLPPIHQSSHVPPPSNYGVHATAPHMNDAPPPSYREALRY